MSLPAKTIAIKVDVDTRRGMEQGVPALLALFAEKKVPATFFLSFGPDRSGTAIWNVFKQKGFFKKMLRTNAIKMYGWRTVLSGTLLPAKPIARDFPQIASRIAAEGHEVGVHAWDHRRWQDKLHRMSREETREQMRLAADSFRSILGRPARSMAAPAWTVNRFALEMEEELDLLYASDSRGSGPFLPVWEGQTFRVPQFPTTLPCVEELVAAGEERPGRGLERFPQLLEALRPEGLNVFPAHAEVEGALYGELMGKFIEAARQRGFGFATLEAVVSQTLASGPVPAKDLVLARLAGRTFPVAAPVA